MYKFLYLMYEISHMRIDKVNRINAAPFNELTFWEKNIRILAWITIFGSIFIVTPWVIYDIIITSSKIAFLFTIISNGLVFYFITKWHIKKKPNLDYEMETRLIGDASSKTLSFIYKFGFVVSALLLLVDILMNRTNDVMYIVGSTIFFYTIFIYFVFLFFQTIIFNPLIKLEREETI